MIEKVNSCLEIVDNELFLSNLRAPTTVEHKYHLICLNRLYKNFEDEHDCVEISSEIPFDELVDHMKSCQKRNQTVFKITDLVQIYNRRCEELGLPQNSTIPYKLIGCFQGARSFIKGRQSFLAFDSDNDNHAYKSYVDENPPDDEPKLPR